MSEAGILRRQDLRTRPLRHRDSQSDGLSALFDASDAPLDRVAMIEVADGNTIWRLPFPCIRKADGWHNARTGKLLTGNFEVVGFKPGETWG